MKRIITFTLSLILLHLSSCKKDEVKMDKSAAELKSVTVESGKGNYKVVPKEGSSSVNIGGVYIASDITGVKCEISDGATINPKLATIKNWSKEQVFTVTSADRMVSNEYRITLNNLDESTVIKRDKYSIAYLKIEDYDQEEIRWEYLTHLVLTGFSVNHNAEMNVGEHSELIKKIAQVAENRSIQLLVSVGEDESGNFSTSITNAPEQLAKNILNFSIEHGLEGVDLDFSQLSFSAAGFSEDLLTFSQEMWKEGRSKKMVHSCLVNAVESSYPMALHQYFDLINIKAFSLKASGAEQHGSYEQFTEAAEKWMNTYNVPKNKLVLGLPFFGMKRESGEMVAYNKIIEDNPEAFDNDQVAGINYNGTITVEKKSQYVKEQDLGGMMYWYFNQDTKEFKTSLLAKVGTVLTPDLGITELFPMRGISMGAPQHGFVNEFCKFIREDMAPMGGNCLMLRVEFDGYRFTNDGGLTVSPTALTYADVKKIVSACRETNIRLIPSINVFGHQSWDNHPGPLLKKYPEFMEPFPSDPHFHPGHPSNTGFYRLWSYCPRYPGLHDVVFKYYDELIEVFEATEFHAGMDEVINIASDNCPHCKGENPAELYAEEVQRIYDHLQSRGCKMYMWGDRFLDSAKEGIPRPSASGVGTAPAISMIKKDITVCDWHYGGNGDTGREAATTKNFVAEDLNVIICSNISYRNALAQMDAVLRFRAQEPDPDKKKKYLGFWSTTWGGYTQAEEFVKIFRKAKDGTITEEEKEKGYVRSSDGEYVGVAGYVYYSALQKAREMESGK